MSILARLLCVIGYHQPRLTRLTGGYVSRQKKLEQIWIVECTRCGRRFWHGAASDLGYRMWEQACEEAEREEKKQ